VNTVRIVSGFTLSSVTLGATLIGQVIAVPVLLSRWGVATYADWVVLTGVVSSVSLLNLGIQSHVGNGLIGHFVRGEYDAGTRLLQAALRLYAVLGAIALGVVAALALSPSALRGLGVAHMPARDAAVVAAVYGLLGTHALVGGLLMAVFRAIQRVPRQLAFGLVERCVLLGAPIVVALAGGGPVAAASAVLAAMVIVGAVAFQQLRRLTPFALGTSRASWRESAALLAPSLAFFGVSAVGPLTASVLTVLAARALGPAGVVTLSTSTMLVNLVRQGIGQLLAVIWPEVTASAAAGDEATVRRARRVTLKAMTLIALIGAVVIGLTGDAVISAWTRRLVTTDPLMLWLLVGFLVLQSPAHVDAVFALAVNRQGRVFVACIVGAALTIVATLATLDALGVSGVALGLLAGQVASTGLLFSVGCRLTSDRLRSAARTMAVASLPTLATAAVGAVAVGSLQGGLMATAPLAAAVSVAVAAMAWATWLEGGERRLLRSAAADGLAFSALILRGRQASA
jgi:O-antigen/teichoic acid export membrane protein